MTQPNIVLIYCDDLAFGDLGCYGSDTMRTPNIDGLAEDGVRFTDFYSNSPVCSPSRASLLTGRHPAKTGVTGVVSGNRDESGLLPTERTLASMLGEYGYRTGIIGKWHLGSSEESFPTAHGFDEFFGHLGGCVDYYSHIMYWIQANGRDPVHDLWENESEVWHNGEYLTELITERSVEFIEDNQEDPFFLYVPYNAPHYPMHAPEEYLDRFPDLPDDQRIMAAMISAVDDGVGEIVDALSRTDQYEDTIVFFSSDNGPSRESRNFLDGSEDPYYGGSSGGFRGHKFSLFEGGIRMPTILSYPAELPQGTVCDGVGQMSDVVPTVLSLCGEDVPDDHECDGKSLASMVADGDDSPHTEVFWRFNDQLAIRRGDWKLTVNGRDIDSDPDEIHLSDLSSDSAERTNLVDEHPDLATELERTVREWADELPPETDAG